MEGHLTGSLGTVRGTGILLHLSLEDREQDTQEEVPHTLLDIHIHTGNFVATYITPGVSERESITWKIVIIQTIMINRESVDTYSTDVA